MINYRFDFDHEDKVIAVTKVTEVAMANYIDYQIVATYKYTAEENQAGLVLISGYIPQEVYVVLAAAFFSWNDINNGFLWKSKFERRI